MATVAAITHLDRQDPVVIPDHLVLMAREVKKESLVGMD